ncbi:hypothetical protein [Candidatus Methylomirabilis limnetica]|uniref:hypothetical protein n=1 Tax=Candidatus Methylomirabilis limnetica TaxID=2033718 RepID=UPI00137B6501|nr:hypothetical protein [Candidatus Methylomirabilis limnetica]
MIEQWKGLPVGPLSQNILAYPTLAEANRRTADQYYREKLFGRPLKKWLRFFTRPA